VSVGEKVTEKHHVVVVLKGVSKTQRVMDPCPLLLLLLILVLVFFRQIYVLGGNVGCVVLIATVLYVKAASMPPNLALEIFLL